MATRTALPLAACLALAGLAAVAPGTSAYEVAGLPWPDGAIVYHVEASGYSKPVARAARIWNARGLPVRFVKGSSDEAGVAIRLGGRACEGSALVGRPRRNQVSVVELGAGCDTSMITLTAVHELGHVLGLGHEGTACARMNASFGRGGTPTNCPPHDLRYWLKHPLQKDDVRGARALYGQ